MKQILGIDQSYSGFGYARILEGDVVAEKMAFPLAKFDSEHQRLLHIHDWLAQVLYMLYPDLVVMEGYSFASKFNREQMGELGGAVKLAIAYRGPSLIVVQPTTLKKFVTGTGNAKKNVMLQQVYKRWGMEFSDDNQADAYSLVKFGQAYLGEYPRLPKAMSEVVEKFRRDNPKG